jgi:putative DNA primase/helicase
VKADANSIFQKRGVDQLRDIIDAAPPEPIPWRDGEAPARQVKPDKEPPDRGTPPIEEKPSKRIRIMMGSNVIPQPISWLWRYWLAHGKFHILAGRPGSLKTTTAIGLCAAVSVGGQWPDRSQATPGRVVIWSGEDAIDDTLLPRFIAAGGDRAQIAFISGVEENGRTRSFDPARDMNGVVAVCADLGRVGLVVIDPVVAVAKGDSHKNAETRRDLQSLVSLAEQTQAAVLGIHHLTKRSEDADPLDRVSGSLAFGAGPRVVLLSAVDRRVGGEPRGVILRAKNNLGPAHGGFNFTAETRPLTEYPDIAAQRILWGAYVNEPARDILARLEGKAVPDVRKAAAFLRGALKGGPRMAAEVFAEGEAAGFNKRALQRALVRLGGSSEKPSFGTGWIWELPEQAPKEGDK